MDIFEVAIGKLKSSLSLPICLVVNPQKPFPVFVKSVETDEYVFVLRGRAVFAPLGPFVPHKFSFVDKVLRMVKCSSVEPHWHDCVPLL